MLARLSKLCSTNTGKCFIAALLIASVAVLNGCAGTTGAPSNNSSGGGSGSGGDSIAISTASLPSGTVGTAYSATLQASGGTTPYSWSVSTGSLPAGLSLNASSGAISGTPTASGTSNFTAQVKDGSNNTSTKSLSIAVSAAAQALAITTTSVPDGSTNTAYSAFLYAGGGKTPYTWSISGGALPAGLTLSAGGDITGVPTAAGNSSFTAKVTDSSSPANTATATFSMTIAQGTAYSVALSWTASPSSGVAGYNVYRSTQSGSNYVRINTAAVSSLTYTDGTVLDGTTYYYVLTAVDGSGNESTYSTEVQLAIP